MTPAFTIVCDAGIIENFTDVGYSSTGLVNDNTALA